jgi:hypothetical protein
VKAGRAIVATTAVDNPTSTVRRGNLFARRPMAISSLFFAWHV